MALALGKDCATANEVGTCRLSAMAIDYLVEGYCAHALHVLCLDTQSVKRYRPIVLDLLESGWGYDAAGMLAFLASRAGRAPTTVGVEITALRSFADWLVMRG